MIISKTQLLKTRSYPPFDFVITKIHAAIRLTEDGKRMVDIYFQLSPSSSFILNSCVIAS